MITYNEICEQYNLPVLAMRGMVVFPSIPVSIEVVRQFSKNAIEAAQKTGSYVYLVAQKDQDEERLIASNLESVGTIAKIKKIITDPSGSIKAIVEGVYRGETGEITTLSGYYSASVTAKSLVVNGYPVLKEEALRRTVKEKINDIISYLPVQSKELESTLSTIHSLAFLCDFVASNLLVKLEDKQKILAEFNEYKRAERLIKILTRESKIIHFEADIQRKTKDKIDEGQKEYYIREQIKVLQGELGNDIQSESDELYDEIVAKKFPKDVEDKLLKELYKFNKAPFGTPESTILRTYIETCLEIPFNTFSKDCTDVALARKILDKDHYGLQRVKERILEFIAVKQLNNDLGNQILCLVGPPGVGKTSLCSSIARALKRKYVRVSLGGVRDEAEIRGHRKTYVGAMPGRIINALIECKTANPVMVFDEIDKMSSDFKGDPASAMLEVLDGEQNKAFRDHFVEMSVDLSRCMFIATANSLENIPKPLIDRMEIIELSSYTKNEKLNIAKNHLVAKQLKRHGLSAKNLKISDSALMDIIDSYTAEAGVRNLEREIASLCRKAAKKIIEDGVKSVSITDKNLSDFLGARKFDTEKIDSRDQIGVVNGLAYTSIGGDLLKIEASVMNGSGKVKLTGQLGDVMKESAEIAISYIRENAVRLGIDPEFHSKNDIHIHVPEGAVPKDGPSAGVTLATALISVLSSRPVRRDVAMTGEITLRGNVLPIGGLKEKTIAGYSAGVSTILIPKKNVKDLEEIDPVVRENVEFIACETIDDVLNASFSSTDGEIVTAFISKCTSYKA